MKAYTFDVGTIRCIAVHDGEAKYHAEDYVANGDRDEVVAALERHGHPPDAIPSIRAARMLHRPRGLS